MKPPKHYRPPSPYKLRKDHGQRPQQRPPKYQPAREPQEPQYQPYPQTYRPPPTRPPRPRYHHRPQQQQRLPPQQQPQDYPQKEEEEEEEVDYADEDYDGEDHQGLAARRRPQSGQGNSQQDQDYLEEYEREPDEGRDGGDYDYEGEEEHHPPTPKAHKHERPDIYVKNKVYEQDDYYNQEEDEKPKYKYNPDDFAVDDGQWDDVFNGHRNIIDEDIKDLSKNHEDYTAPEGHEPQGGGGGQEQEQEQEREAENTGVGDYRDEDRDYRQQDSDYRNQERDNSQQDRGNRYHEQDPEYREQDYREPDDDYRERSDYHSRDRDYNSRDRDYEDSSSKRPDEKEQSDYEDIDDMEAERDPRGDGYGGGPDFRYRDDYEGDYPTQHKNSHDQPERGRRHRQEDSRDEGDYSPEAMTDDDDRELSRNINENEKAAENLRYQDEQVEEEEDGESGEGAEGGKDYDRHRRPPPRSRGRNRENSRSGFYPGSGARPGNADIPGFDSFFNMVESKIEEEINGAPSWAVPQHDMEKKDKPADGVIDNSEDLKPNVHNQDIEPHSFDFQMPSHEELAENYQTVSASNLSPKWSPVKMKQEEEKKKDTA